MNLYNSMLLYVIIAYYTCALFNVYLKIHNTLYMGDDMKNKTKGYILCVLTVIVLIAIQIVFISGDEETETQPSTSVTRLSAEGAHLSLH